MYGMGNIIFITDRKKVLLHHPDKRKAAGKEVLEDDDYFTNITKGKPEYSMSTKCSDSDRVGWNQWCPPSVKRLLLITMHDLESVETISAEPIRMNCHVKTNNNI